MEEQNAVPLIRKGCFGEREAFALEKRCAFFACACVAIGKCYGLTQELFLEIGWTFTW